MRSAKFLVGLSCAAMLSGCATVSSVNLRSAEAVEGETPPPPPPMTPGLTYYLPRQLVKLTVEKSDPDPVKLDAAKVRAQAALAAATAARTKIETDIDAIKKKIVALPDGSVAQKFLIEDLEALKKTLAPAQTAEKAAKAAETEAIAAITAFNARGRGGLGTHTVLKLELLPMAPDPSHAYRLDPKHSILRDDQHKITLTPSGLLTSTDIVAADRTADVLAEIAVFAGYAAGLKSKPVDGVGILLTDGTDMDAQALEAQKLCANAPNKVVAIVDLARYSDIAAFNRDVSCLGIKIELATGRDGYLSGISSETYGKTSGIFYRPVVDAALRVSFCGADVCVEGQNPLWFLKDTINVPLPQFGAISPVPQQGGFMTRTTYKNTFKDGVLVSYDADRPSEVLEFARTPVRLVDGAFSGLSKVISLRTGANSGKVTLSASELATFAALSSDAEKMRLYQKCADEKSTAGEPLLPCLDLLK